jgi:rubrerythrin
VDKEQKQTLEALQKAIQMEIEGKEFYQHLSKTLKNESGRKLFAVLATEEDQHRRNFEQIFHDIEAKQGWPEIEIGLSQAAKSAGIFNQPAAERLKSTSIEMKAVEKAMEMENKTRDFYIAQSVQTGYPVEKRYYEALAGQESAHHALLLDYYEFLKDPAQWFTVKEHQSLDGG